MRFCSARIVPGVCFCSALLSPVARRRRRRNPRLVRWSPSRHLPSPHAPPLPLFCSRAPPPLVQLRSFRAAIARSYLGQFEIQSGKANAGDAAKRHYVAAKELLEPLCATNVKQTDLYRIQALAFLQSLASLDKTLTRRR